LVVSRALDSRSGRAVLALLRETIDESGGTLVMVTRVAASSAPPSVPA
jgi:ABC-type lipoprotein export system ATPase subunit